MDVVVTVPKSFRHPSAPELVGLLAWLAEGDSPGDEPTNIEWAFSVSGRPSILPGERVYVVCEGRLVGYSPLVRLACVGGRADLIRAGGAVACTINEPITGFRGFRYRWWDREKEKPLDLSRKVATAQAMRTSRWRDALAASSIRSHSP